jgi:HlyD family secretion protein
VSAVATRAEFTPRVALTENERADLLFAVRVELADSTGRLKAGLPVTVHLLGTPP